MINQSFTIEETQETPGNTFSVRPASSKFAKAKALRSYVTELLERKRQGETVTIPANRELAEQFGYTNSESVGNSLRAANLLQGVMAIKQENHRATKIIDYATELLERRQDSEMVAIPTNREIAQQIGSKGRDYVGQVLKKAGLQQAIMTARQKDREIGEESLVVPSAEWAWILGVLSGKGYVKDGNITISSKNKDLLEAIERTGEFLFRKTPSTYYRTDLTDGKKHGIKHLGSLRVTNSIGDLTQHNRLQTVVDKHSWILKDTRYLWSFIGGLFDVRGYVFLAEGKTGYISFDFGNRQTAYFMAELLVRGGISRPLVYSFFREDKNDERFLLRISNHEDMQKFANSISPKVADKEKRLQRVREHIPKKNRISVDSR